MNEKRNVLFEIDTENLQNNVIELFPFPREGMSCPRCQCNILEYSAKTDEYRCHHCHKGMTNTIKSRIGERGSRKYIHENRSS